MNIAIKFGDNDFWHTFTGVLKVISEAIEHQYGSLDKQKSKLTKEQWAIIINEISYGCYLLFQNSFEYNEEGQTGKPQEHSRQYLKIKPKQILLGKEVEEFLSKTDWDNSETFYLLHGTIDSR